MVKRRTREQIEADRQEKVRRWLKQEAQKEARNREKLAEAARKKEAAKRREWLRKQRSRPRLELPTVYQGESIFVHKQIYERFMKREDIQIVRSRVEGGQGGKLIMDYVTAAGGSGRLELLDLGPMPTA